MSKKDDASHDGDEEVKSVEGLNQKGQEGHTSLKRYLLKLGMKTSNRSSPKSNKSIAPNFGAFASMVADEFGEIA